MNWYLIPLQNISQTFIISLSGVNYQLTVKWNDSDEAGWVFDLAQSDTDTPLINGAPLITGADCLEGLSYLNIGGAFIVTTNGAPADVPTFENLGTDSNLYFVTTESST